MRQVQRERPFASLGFIGEHHELDVFVAMQRRELDNHAAHERAHAIARADHAYHGLLDKRMRDGHVLEHARRVGLLIYRAAQLVVF